MTENDKNRDQRNTNNKMSRRVEVIINSSAPQDQAEPPLHITESKPGEHPGVKGFLKIHPEVLGWLEILTGSIVFGLVYWNYDLWLLIPACFVILIGVITALAACTRNPCLVITSQVLNLLNICNVVTAVLVFFVIVFLGILKDVFFGHLLRAHFLNSRSESSQSLSTNIAFVACNVLALIFSLLIIMTLCCWCKRRKRLMVIHMNAADVVDHLHPESSPPAYSPVPSSDPPAYEEERRSTLSGVSAQKWAMRKWKEELQRSRKPIQV